MSSMPGTAQKSAWGLWQLTFLLLLIVIFSSGKLDAAPFSCSEKLYQVGNGVLYQLKDSAGLVSWDSIAPIHGDVRGINCIGYNVLDNYAYAMRIYTDSLIQLHSDGSTVNLGPVSGLPSTNSFNSGVCDLDGYLYVSDKGSNSPVWKIDIANRSAVQLANGTIYPDMVFNPITGFFYSVPDNGQSLAVYDPVNGNQPSIPITAGDAFPMTSAVNYGSVWITSAAEYFAYNNSSGSLHRIVVDTASGTAQSFQIGITSKFSSNDGFSCWGAYDCAEHGPQIQLNGIQPIFGIQAGVIDISITGGLPPYRYLWSNLDTSEDLSTHTPGTYIMGVTDSMGCVTSDTFVLADSIPLPVPFDCNGFMFHSADGDLYGRLPGGSGTAWSYIAAIHGQAPNFNSLGFNVQDRYAYGIQINTTNLVRLHETGWTDQLGPVSGLRSGPHSACMDNAGNLYACYKTDTDLQIVDLQSQSVSGTVYVGPGRLGADIAYDPGTHAIYSLRDAGDQLCRIELATGTVNMLPISDDPASTQNMRSAVNFGSVWVQNGKVYVYNNSHGDLHELSISGNTATALFVDATTPYSSNDGFDCRPYSEPTSIGFAKYEERFGIYPNPTSGPLFIKGDRQHIQSVELVSIDGRQLAVWKPDMEIDLAMWPDGAYLIRFMSVDGRQEVYRLLKN